MFSVHVQFIHKVIMQVLGFALLIVLDHGGQGFESPSPIYCAGNVRVDFQEHSISRHVVGTLPETTN
jgi:hypothetical protein